MTTRRRGIEKRLFEAVMLVLAGAGCYTSSPPPTEPHRQPDPPPPPPPHGDDRTTDPWTTLPADSDDITTNNTSNSPSLATANQICAKHKRTQLDPSKIPALPSPAPAQMLAIAETSNWDANRNAARCVLVRERRPAQVSVTHTPRCCPHPGGTRQPCPPPQTYTQQGMAHLVEHANVAADGTVLASKLTWNAISPPRRPEPYCGRLPEGARALGDRATGPRAMADHLAAMAELEAASIPAFDRLARELAAHGAPADLVRRARRAMGDEIRHERVMRELAAEHGATPRAIAVTALPCRSLEAIARENAIEGCVREAYGALVATYQAERAPAELRPTFCAIAADERSHAALAEDVHAWILEQLDTAERTSIEQAREAAEDELRANLSAMPQLAELGMPEPAHAVAMFEAYFGSRAAIEQR